MSRTPTCWGFSSGSRSTTPRRRHDHRGNPAGRADPRAPGRTRAPGRRRPGSRRLRGYRSSAGAAPRSGGPGLRTLRGDVLGRGHGGLADVVRSDKRFEQFERLVDGRITAYFADDTSDTGDVLVAADGVGPRVRAAFRPGDEPRDLGVRTIFSRIPMARAFANGLAEIHRDSFTSVLGSDGH